MHREYQRSADALPASRLLVEGSVAAASCTAAGVTRTHVIYDVCGQPVLQCTYLVTDLTLKSLSLEEDMYKAS